MSRRLIAVVGTGRNGSTLLPRLLDGADGLYVHLPEANFLASFNDLTTREWVTQRVRQNACKAALRRLDARVPGYRLLRFHAHHRDEIRRDALDVTGDGPLGPDPEQGFAENGSYDVAGFVRALLDAYERWIFGADSTNRSLLFKTIETPYVGDYERLFPEMQFVHIIRDPVDTYASAKRTMAARKRLPPWYLGGDVLRTLIRDRWLPHARWIHARRDHPNHHVVRMEDLLAAPGQVIERLCARLSLTPPPEPTVQTVRGGMHPERMLSYSSGEGAVSPREVSTGLDDRFGYAAVVSERERRFIRFATWRAARRLDYFAGEHRPDAAAVRRDWWRIDASERETLGSPAQWGKAITWMMSRRAYVRRHTASDGS